MRIRKPALSLLVVALGLSACYRPYGFRLYPDAPRLEPTDPGAVVLLRRQPRRDHIRLGEVWIRPTRGMDRYVVEAILSEKAALMGADALVIVVDRYLRERVVIDYWRGPMALYERQIVGIAIRFRRQARAGHPPVVSAPYDRPAAGKKP